jgi:predicted small lipoprotein YifL
MRSKARLFVVVLALFLLAGCATKGPKFNELSPSMANMAPETSRIYIYRISVLGAAVQPAVKLNDEVIGKAVPNGFFYVDKEPGNYTIKTSTEVERQLSLTLEKGQTRYVRLNISLGFFVGHVYPELVDAQVGEKEIQECRYIGEKTVAAHQ